MSGEKLLLHICCYPCFYVSGEKINTGEFSAIAGYYFNPNIHPYSEYSRRLKTLTDNTAGIFPPLEKGDSGGFDLVSIINAEKDYPLLDFIREIVSAKDRCYACYNFRFRRTAFYAKENGYRVISTTLLASPHQKTGMIRDLMKKVSVENGLKFYDFEPEPGYGRKMRDLKDKGVYVQRYCGCIFSEYERNANCSRRI